jgi:hypothetical protein
VKSFNQLTSQFVGADLVLMVDLRTFLLLVSGVLFSGGSWMLQGEEPLLLRHYWPWEVNESDETSSRSTWAGPFVEHYRDQHEDFFAVRPFFLDEHPLIDPLHRRTRSVLYPIWVERTYESHRYWSFLNLIRWSRIEAPDVENPLNPDLIGHYRKAFEIFPFYFNHRYNDPTQDYLGVFPFYGEIKGRLLHERIGWTLFPLYGEFERRGERTRSFLWPIIRIRSGPESHGLSVWPLAGYFTRDNDYRERFALWPLIYYHEYALSAPTPTVKLGILPFFASETREGYQRKDYLWPFFGYTRAESPQYNETRALWPIYVQGRGSQRYLNQVAPFYSISHRNEKSSYWVLWPLFNLKKQEENGWEIRKFRMVYFLYQNTTFRRAPAPSATQESPVVSTRRHLWPLFSYVEQPESGVQLQILSPLEPLLPRNATIRRQYSPLFALYRYSERSAQDKDMNMLFSLIRFQRRPEHERLELGPLLGCEYGASRKRFDLLKGFLGYESDANRKHLRLLWLRIPIGKKTAEPELDPK